MSNVQAMADVKVLITCPPMLVAIDGFRSRFEKHRIQIHCPKVIQTLSENELLACVPDYDGWIVGDDQVTRTVLQAGRHGRLKAVVKWGIGVDNIDFIAANEYGILVKNTPFMFGREVADVAMAYIIGLARETFFIDREVRVGRWPKPQGISLSDKIVGLVGYGDIGKNIATRAMASDMRVLVYDPVLKAGPIADRCEAEAWPKRLGECDFIVFACSLTSESRHMLNADTLAMAKDRVRIVNIARGPLIDESALVEGLQSGKIRSAALEVMETEPLPMESALRKFDRCIFGSHNASNTIEAVQAASERAMALLFEMLAIKSASCDYMP